MGTQTLQTAMLASMAVVAVMIAINARGRWRSAFSSLLAVCLLGMTAWIIILQFSIGSDAQGAHYQPAHTSEETGYPDPMLPVLITQAIDFSSTLIRKNIRDSAYDRDQLIERARSTEQQFETLQNEINNHRRSLDSASEPAKHLEHALAELRAACHLYNTFYFTESAEAETSIERLFRQKTQNARESFQKAESALKRH
ncbi:MAG: hypothetical protein LBU70_02650 [Chitinispirillales bacterium]|jgi:hypothetical protein|nr:hypothetical protein [Chitinispirillales bacterium]